MLHNLEAPVRELEKKNVIRRLDYKGLARK
jgi:hypothetical protein